MKSTEAQLVNQRYKYKYSTWAGLRNLQTNEDGNVHPRVHYKKGLACQPQVTM